MAGRPPLASGRRLCLYYLFCSWDCSFDVQGASSEVKVRGRGGEEYLGEGRGEVKPTSSTGTLKASSSLCRVAAARLLLQLLMKRRGGGRSAG